MELLANYRNAQFESLISHVKSTQEEAGSSAAAVYIIQNNEVVAEWYNGTHHFKKGARQVTAQSLFNIYSTRKTYVGLAMAMAVIEGKLNLDTPVYEIVEDIPRDQLDEVTLRNLATKTGAKYYGLDRIEREELAGKLIEKVTGYNIAELITRRILEPLEIDQTEWITAPNENLVCDFQALDGYASVRIESNEGHERNLYTSARDLALWGYLHLNKGYIHGNQLLNTEVFDLAEALKLTEDREKRLFGWYYQKDWYSATGAAGCHCVVFPEYNAVGVRMLNRYVESDPFNEILLGCLRG